MDPTGEAQNLRRLISLSPAIIYCLRVEGDRLIPTWVSDNIREFTGYTTEEGLSPTWWPENVHPEDFPYITANLALMATQDLLGSEYRFRHKNGQYRWFRDEQRVIRDAAGTPIELIGSWMDITAQKTLQAELSTSRSQFRRLVDTNLFGSLVGASNGLVLEANDAALNLLGYSRQDLEEGRLRWDQVTPPEFAHLNLAAAKEAVAKGACTPLEKEYIRKDGTRIPVMVGMAHLSGTDTLITFMLDLTQVKQAEKALQIQNELLEQKVAERTAKVDALLKEMEHYAAAVAHDLRAPLRAMHGFSHALLEDCCDDIGELGKNYAQRIKSAALRMDGMVSGLLEFNRIGRLVVEIAPISLDQLVSDLLNEWQPVLQKSGCETIVVPPLGHAIGDRRTLYQIIGNLVSNAVKFHDRRQPPQIKFSAERRADRLRLWIEDNGIGIASEDQERIFSVFERLHGAEAYEGTGMGLAIAKKGIEQLGGYLGLESVVGEGSRFWIELPISPADQGPPDTLG